MSAVNLDNKESVYAKRREKIYDWMAREGVALAVVEDGEGRRDPGLRWLTGHPSDALCMLSVDRKAVLVPWDINMAMLYAQADAVLPYTDFERQAIKAVKGVAGILKTPPGSKIEIPGVTPYPRFLNFVESLGDFDVICREDGIRAEVEKRRAVKDADEIAIYRKVSEITSDITDLLEQKVRGGELKTEADVAMFIAAESRRRGCEGSGFETLAAGPARSFGIHCFPAWTGGPFACGGLSILDYGLSFAGYTSDVTLTFAREPLSKAQEKTLGLVEKAHKLAAGMLRPGLATREVALEVDAFFGKAKKAMPHALGHGIGLEAHEMPSIRSRSDNTWVLEPGMVVTLEPGLYDPEQGGCRLENDYLITETGAELLTNSRIIRL